MPRKIQVEIVGDSRDIERAFKRAGNSADKFGRKLRGLAGKGLGGRKGLLKGAGVSGALGGAGLVGGAIFGGVASVKAAAGFEKTMARVQGLAGQSQKQVAAWGNELLSLGPKLGKAPTELAEALYFVASSGVPAAKAIDVVTASAKAAAAGLGETEVVADAVTSLMNAYGPATVGAVRATDALVATVREGKGEADAFAGVIGNVAAFASRLKVPIEEVGAALAAMTQLGTDPATAATQLQAFFSSVLKVSSATQKKADKIGFSFETLTGILASGDLRGALKYIQDFARDNGGIQALALMFPNIRALRALLALTAEDGGKVAGVFARMRDSSGSLGVAFGAAQKTAAHNMAKFTASIETLKIAFGQGLLPMVTKVSQALATKLADPAFVAKVRELGVLVGTKLYAAFQAISKWFAAHWDEIKSGFRTGAQIAQKMASAVRRIANGLERVASISPGGAGTLIGLLLSGVLLVKLRKVMGALAAIGLGGGMAGGKGKGKGKGGAKGGKGGGLGKVGGAVAGLAASGAGREIAPEDQSLTMLDDFQGALKLARQGKLSQKALAALSKRLTPKQMRILRRINAGRGRGGKPPRSYPGASFGGLGGVGRGPNARGEGNTYVYIDGQPIANVVTKRQQRTDKSTAASRRGRYGGVKR